jgi:hypothetical protein
LKLRDSKSKINTIHLFQLTEFFKHQYTHLWNLTHRATEREELQSLKRRTGVNEVFVHSRFQRDIH